MTLKRLNEFRKEVLILKISEKEINVKADSIPGGRISGMPSAKGSGNSKEQKYMTCLSEKDFLKKGYAKLLKKHSDTLKYIESIEDYTTRLIFQYRFISGYSWNKVAMKIGGGNTADSVRMQVNRYLQKN